MQEKKVKLRGRSRRANRKHANTHHGEGAEAQDGIVDASEHLEANALAKGLQRAHCRADAKGEGNVTKHPLKMEREVQRGGRKVCVCECEDVAETPKVCCTMKERVRCRASVKHAAETPGTAHNVVSIKWQSKV